jgi:hypothetical protein
VDIGDATAKLLGGKTLDDVYKVAAKLLNASEKSPHDRYTHLNAGQQRMTLGNRIRAPRRRRRSNESERLFVWPIRLRRLYRNGGHHDAFQ